MTDPMTPERLAEIEARANAATQGPWEWHPYMGSGATLAKPNHPFHELNILKTTDDWPPVAADAEFIAHARTDVPALLAEVRRLQAAATPAEPIEPLPEYMHQSLPIASLRRAIELLELAKSTDKPQDRLELLRRADAQTMYARDTAKSAMARWRHWNKRACTLGFLATYGPPPDPPVLDGQDPLI